MAHTYTCLLHHVVFSTAGREPLIGPDWRSDLYAYIGGVVRGQGQVLLNVGGVADHVHLLMSFKATAVLPDVVRAIKSGSSGWASKNQPRARHFAWQQGYGAFTVSKSQCEGVSDYIGRQQEHHQKRTFQEEFIGLLKKHGVEYDPEHIWD